METTAVFGHGTTDWRLNNASYENVSASSGRRVLRDGKRRVSTRTVLSTVFLDNAKNVSTALVSVYSRFFFFLLLLYNCTHLGLETQKRDNGRRTGAHDDADTHGIRFARCYLQKRTRGDGYLAESTIERRTKSRREKKTTKMLMWRGTQITNNKYKKW